MLEPWVGRSVSLSTSCSLSGQLQLCPPQSTIHHLAGSASCRFAMSPLHLPVFAGRMNVSSLFPWLLDFHTVRFSVSSGCFIYLFFKNCCCPSFGCARRHSVSTYSSIMAKSPSVCRFINLIFLVIVVLVEFSSSSLGCYSLRNCPGSRHFPILQLTLKCNIMSEDPNELELSFGGWGHCSTGFPSVSVY